MSMPEPERDDDVDEFPPAEIKAPPPENLRRERALSIALACSNLLGMIFFLWLGLRTHEPFVFGGSILSFLMAFLAIVRARSVAP